MGLFSNIVLAIDKAHSTTEGPGQLGSHHLVYWKTGEYTSRYNWPLKMYYVYVWF